VRWASLKATYIRTYRTLLMLLFPQRVILTPFGRYDIHGYTYRRTNKVLIDQ
jgi:hypothetical protein